MLALEAQAIINVIEVQAGTMMMAALTTEITNWALTDPSMAGIRAAYANEYATQ